MARAQVLALAEVLELDKILIYSRSDKHAQIAFAEEFSELTGVDVGVGTGVGVGFSFIHAVTVD